MPVPLALGRDNVRVAVSSYPAHARSPRQGNTARLRLGAPSLWLVSALVVLGTGLFTLSYLGALARPAPHRLALALVAPTPVVTHIVDALQLGAPGVLDVQSYRSFSQARSALLALRVDGVLVPGPTLDTLYVAEAAGPPIVTALEQVIGSMAAHQHVPLTVNDTVPLPAGDSSGLGLFYLVLACVLGGYVGTIMILSHTGSLSASRRTIQLAFTSMLCGAMVTSVARFGLHSDPLPIPGAPMIAALSVFAVAVCTWALLLGLGRLAAPVAIGVFVLLGSPSSGGAIPRSMLPSFYSSISPWLPNGAAISALRDITFFPAASINRPVLVLASWALVGLVGALILSRRRRRMTEQA